MEQHHLGNYGRGHYEEHFCEITLNFKQRFRRRCRFFFRYFVSRALAAVLLGGKNCFVNFVRGHYEKHFCEIILNLDQWFRKKCRFEIFLTKTLAAILFGEQNIFGNGKIIL